MTPSNANTSGLDHFGWWVEHTVAEPMLIRPPAFCPASDNYTITPLVTAASAQARIAELEAERDTWKTMAENGAQALPQYVSRATAAEARTAEASMLAYRWMEAHDRLKAGLDYDLPSPADLPAEKARADRLAKALDDCRLMSRQAEVQAIARAALQQETQP